MTEPVGMIGIGLLGTAIAERLLGSGFDVLGYDLVPERRGHLQKIGGSIAPDAAAVMACQRVVLSLPDSTAVSEVVSTILPRAPGNALIIDTTTGDPEVTEQIGDRCAAVDVAYVDATVVGSSQQASHGVATVLVGGLAEHVARALPLLNTFARQVFHVGPCGGGARMKLVVNLVLGLNRAALAEGLSLAKACQLDLTQTLEVLMAGAAHSAVMEAKGAKMIAEDFSVQARLRQHEKDVRLVQQLAQANGAHVPLTDTHRELLRQAIERGWGDADNSAIVKVFTPRSSDASGW